MRIKTCIIAKKSVEIKQIHFLSRIFINFDLLKLFIEMEQISGQAG